MFVSDGRGGGTFRSFRGGSGWGALGLVCAEHVKTAEHRNGSWIRAEARHLPVDVLTISVGRYCLAASISRGARGGGWRV
eukprot:COSAG01_NODE_6124_length_3838_cov_405.005884_4_plen_80_part_00